MTDERCLSHLDLAATADGTAFASTRDIDHRFSQNLVAWEQNVAFTFGRASACL